MVQQSSRTRRQNDAATLLAKVSECDARAEAPDVCFDLSVIALLLHADGIVAAEFVSVTGDSHHHIYGPHACREARHNRV